MARRSDVSYAQSSNIPTSTFFSLPSLSLLSDLSVLLSLFLHLFFSPYTKVEESFNVQALHDLFYHGLGAEGIEKNYDHLVFSGVVPRTFIGPGMIYLLAYPFTILLPSMKKEQVLFLSRSILATIWYLSFLYFRRAFCNTVSFIQQQRKGSSASFSASSFASCTHLLNIFFCLLSICQFHLLFYASRPLANTFASIFINVALGHWIKAAGIAQAASAAEAQLAGAATFSFPHPFSSKCPHAGCVVAWLAFTTIVFRCDMIILSICILLTSLAYRWIPFKQMIIFGVLSSVLSIRKCNQQCKENTLATQSPALLSLFTGFARLSDAVNDWLLLSLIFRSFFLPFSSFPFHCFLPFFQC